MIKIKLNGKTHSAKNVSYSFLELMLNKSLKIGRLIVSHNLPSDEIVTITLSRYKDDLEHKHVHVMPIRGKGCNKVEGVYFDKLEITGDFDKEKVSIMFNGFEILS